GAVQVKGLQRLLPVVHDHGVKALLCQIQGNQLRDIFIVVYDQYFLFVYHIYPPSQMVTALAVLYLNSTIVTPASPSPKAARWNSFTCVCLRGYLSIPLRSAPVPLPWTMRTWLMWAR